MKQRLNYLQQLSLEHQTEYKKFENNLQLLRAKNDQFKQRIPSQLAQITIEDIRTIDVSNRVFLEDIEQIFNQKKNTKTFSNRRFIQCPC